MLVGSVVGLVEVVLAYELISRTSDHTSVTDEQHVP